MKVPYQNPRRIMFVCLGNHCRSPLAHGYFQYLLKKHNLEGEIEVSSSGTSGWHLGEFPDRRVCQVVATAQSASTWRRRPRGLRGRGWCRRRMRQPRQPSLRSPKAAG
ncbi:MAG: hypothetical protein F4Y81_09205 [Rhodothermaceae bacterium]|nr:hypothetical protein [Rhodothermaceae bacterium]MXW33900.1 hypothetical protein [Rhodothermaceae bacterium]MXZ18386.1 hypothetical protein [Rhodothermaceae bacterium]MYE61784.1 hypothetical protein [Rhodothermaceae bacterium]MYG68845.1 hypothetical protein [Rhodothermaceae bacterium]